jgi:hypothetical protein
VRRLTLAVVLALVAAPAATAGEQPVPTCFGVAATQVGTPGNDVIWGTPGDDVIVSGRGNDQIRRSAGDDLICAGTGADRLAGGAGNDRLDGGYGHDVLFGGLGDDDLVGGGSPDVCFQDAGTGTKTTCEPQLFSYPLRPSTAGRYGPYHHDYPATDMFTDDGTTFVAVTSGIVEQLSRVDTWDPEVDDPATRSGLFVAIVGDDCIRYHGSHLLSVADGIEVGTRVRAGQVLGLTDHSGNARFTQPHLHFGLSNGLQNGWWKVRRGQFPPYEWLNRWREGEDVSPRRLLDGAPPCFP